MTLREPVTGSAACPVELANSRVELSHGSGGKRSRMLIDAVFRQAFHDANSDDSLVLVDGTRHDSAVLELLTSRLAVTTDSYVVSPLFFPGGDIGSLAVYGTLNDLSMVGALPRALTASFILEEGFALSELHRIVRSMANATREQGVQIVAGDTKVVQKGHGDGVYINTTGVGMPKVNPAWCPERIRQGDAVLVSGDVGRHGMAVLGAREGFEFQTLSATALTSDLAPLWPVVQRLLPWSASIGCLRDLTRGGLGTVLLELSEHTGLAIELEEAQVPVSDSVRSCCELLGLDPLYIACEGRFVCFARPDVAGQLVALLGELPQSRGAAVVGRVTTRRAGVYVRGALGTERLLDGMGADQLPRIC